MEEIEARHFRNSLREEGPVRDLVIQANEVLTRLRDLYGQDLSRHSALELRDERLADTLSGLVEDLSFEDEIVANFWVDIADHDLTGDYIPSDGGDDFYGLDQIGQIGEYWSES